MPLTIQELKALKDDLRRTRELVDQGFSSAKAAGEIALELRAFNRTHIPWL